MRILYLSSHSILEFQELKLLGELGHDYLSLGYFYDPYRVVEDPIRPSLPAECNLFDELKGDWRNEDSLTKEQLDHFDLIIYMHEPNPEQPRVTKNWEKLKGRNVIWRSIGQSSRLVEKALAPCKKEGLKIMRYSPKEDTIPWYCGTDAMIRFYNDPEEFKGWTGHKKNVISVAQNMKSRRSACNFDAFMQATEPFERRLFGRENESAGLIGGALSYEDLKKEYRENRVYFYTGTQPASYTLNFMEAFMTGIPVVALGPKFTNRDYPEQKTYEVHELIENGVTGFWSNDLKKLQEYIQMLLDDEALARKIGDAGRKKAIELFGVNTIRRQWSMFLDGIKK